MTNPFALYRFPLLAALLLGLAACGGDGDGGGDDGFTPTLPRDAVTITAANAGDIASAAVGSLESASLLTEASAAAKATAGRPALAEISRWMMQRAIRGQFVAARSVSENCGSTSAEGRITGTASDSATSVDSELRFEQCNIGGSGIVLDGSMTLRGTVNASGDYDLRFNSRIGVTFGSEPTITLTMDSRQAGNDFSGDYTLDFSMSIDGPPNTGFLMETTETLVGNAISEEIYSGTIILYGAGNTRLRLDVIATDFVDIDIDEGSGTFSNYDEVDLNTL